MNTTDFLLDRGWQPQPVAGLFTGLWRHPFKASGRELTTPQALQVETGPTLPEDEIRSIVSSLI